MPEGPGKYDALTQRVFVEAEAETVVVLVIKGNKGTGFSMTSCDQNAPAKLPAALRDCRRDRGFNNVVSWHRPIPRLLVPTKFRDFVTLGHETQLPIAPHPGAYGVKRKHHTHEGVDLYCSEGTQVDAVEAGEVMAVIPFTGPHADPPSSWWHTTWAILIEGDSGVVVYGEVMPRVILGAKVKQGEQIGTVLQVLKTYKGYPMSMLHLELHEHGTRYAWDWIDEKPASLRDPTPFLLEAR